MGFCGGYGRELNMGIQILLNFTAGTQRENIRMLYAGYHDIEKRGILVRFCVIYLS